MEGEEEGGSSLFFFNSPMTFSFSIFSYANIFLKIIIL